MKQREPHYSGRQPMIQVVPEFVEETNQPAVGHRRQFATIG